jgi:hypothetical protein
MQHRGPVSKPRVAPVTPPFSARVATLAERAAFPALILPGPGLDIRRSQGQSGQGHLLMDRARRNPGATVRAPLFVRAGQRRARRHPAARAAASEQNQRSP